MATPDELARLRKKALEVRRRIVTMMGPDKKHHFGDSLSAADIVTALYFHKMRYDPSRPNWPKRDRFLMSKGHSVPAQYAALAMLGVFPLEELHTLKRLGSRLQGHPAMHETPGLEGCTGALGEGLSYANGMALAGRILGLSCNVYCLLGDGELQEGQVWEAAMTAAKHCLSNVVAIVDQNGLKAMDETECSKPLQPLLPRWTSFGWAATEIDGHDMAAICDALDWADGQDQSPAVIIAHTVKGKGVSFMEGQPGYHNAALTQEEFRQTLNELSVSLEPTEES
ncbi:MAG: transketolase [bacterium]